MGAVDILLDEGILQGPAVSAERVPCCLALHHRPKNQAGVVLGQRDAGAHVLDGCVHAGGVGRLDGAVQAEEHEPKQLGHWHRELIIKKSMCQETCAQERLETPQSTASCPALRPRSHRPRC